MLAHSPGRRHIQWKTKDRVSSRMSSRITFRPSGHQFVAEAGETLLSAALRAGLSPRYNCDNGSCGACRARVLSGSVARVDFHDYPLSEADKLAGMTLLCRTHANGDMELEAEEASHTSDISQQCISAKLGRLQLLNDRAAILHVRAPRSQVFRFLAGQHVRVQLGKLPPRELPVASCPCNGLHLQFHLLRDDADPFLRHVFTAARPGDGVELSGPTGDFVLDENSSAPLLFLAWENGFAPINSLIEHVIALELPNPVTLCWVAGDRDGLYLEPYCRSWADALDNFTFVPHIGPGAAELPSVIREQLTSGAHLDSSEVYAAILPAQTGPVQQVFESMGIPSERLHIDAVQ
jgi:CDP-4-dehydro-6-deoxyglucose reductase